MDLLQTRTISCPYCGEQILIIIDCSISEQDYIEDCQVCCRPINLHAEIIGEYIEIQATNEND